MMILNKSKKWNGTCIYCQEIFSCNGSYRKKYCSQSCAKKYRRAKNTSHYREYQRNYRIKHIEFYRVYEKLWQRQKRIKIANIRWLQGIKRKPNPANHPWRSFWTSFI